jgi:hypothetical protein
MFEKTLRLRGCKLRAASCAAFHIGDKRSPLGSAQKL